PSLLLPVQLSSGRVSSYTDQYRSESRSASRQTTHSHLFHHTNISTPIYYPISPLSIRCALPNVPNKPDNPDSSSIYTLPYCPCDRLLYPKSPFFSWMVRLPVIVTGFQ